MIFFEKFSSVIKNCILCWLKMCALIRFDDLICSDAPWRVATDYPLYIVNYQLFIGVIPSYVAPFAGVPLASVAVPCCSISEGTHSVLKSSVELLVSFSTLRPSDVSDSILRRTLLK